MHLPDEIRDLIESGAIFYCSHSGGKDSQAMYARLRQVIPNNQLVVVHANLGEVEWPGVVDHIRRFITHPLHVVKANKTFLGMVEARGMWPSAAYRQCTSDLKRGPIFKFIRNDLKERGATIAVNCMGLRAAESASRAKREPLRYNVQESVNGRVVRHVWDWLPVFDLATEDVFREIREAGEEPFWAYADGNERLSCVFCIMGSVNDLRHGAICNPDLYRRYVELERKIGHTMFMKGKESISLEDHVGIKID
ncbi:MULTISPECIES: phosphoadenosine phosphosulfate reductase family protein [unclassified Paenibacillus]|uniref:phosphoadenosine phosphosulfate reductase domain-containing protein n=1 Tax=unclassified Paenibacillus TaxID=185978 RepID=UPI002406543A|nr:MULTISPECIES: phosphoadenosine phosphosulfate reductase family protein [unclassified Paenibacillus]MDF9845197.1 DNA sulfur modification protein DndC [Paenibacillus sp. PastF-2]MDF9850311.1 DNA sulfur modification protein DndC [Paenibacillus sp. PastM-2]MDF9856986.1 DNA sulfur modification protein DndC [Paenibacillus sp. PastF-1]MDH6482157.1 DNA sulfur modification protein DndC [Paenibacillus sp. PastH-2]MDH6509679.1 DNA sulfur modification protein DndC [Paenibacillus sp. PastM-3]